MLHVLQDIQTVPGVVGSCVFSSREGIVASNLPAVFRPEKLASACKMLVKVYGAGQQGFSDVNEVSVCYEETSVVVRQVDPDQYLVVLCDPSASTHLLTMSVNLVMGELRSRVRSPAEEKAKPAPRGEARLPPRAAPAPPPPPRTSPTTRPPPSAPAAAPIPAFMGPALKATEACLAKIIGPMATIVFADAVEEWGARAQPTPSNVHVLLEILDREIGEAERIAKFRDLVAPHWPGGKRR